MNLGQSSAPPFGSLMGTDIEPFTTDSTTLEKADLKRIGLFCGPVRYAIFYLASKALFTADHTFCPYFESKTPLVRPRRLTSGSPQRTARPETA